MNENKRLYSRLAFDCPAQCSFLDSFPEAFPVMITDIGPDGVGLVCDQPLNAGDSVYIMIDLGVGGVVKFIAKVRWSRNIVNSTQVQVGIKIFDASDKDLEKFIKFYYGRLVPGQEQRKRILVIDNDKEKAESLRCELIKYQYGVACAFDGESGFSKYVTERPDLIILNIALPKLSGYEICRKIRRLQNDNDVVMFMLIAKKGDKMKTDDHDLGIQKYFLKSVPAGELAEEAHKALLVSGDDQASS